MKHKLFLFSVLAMSLGFAVPPAISAGLPAEVQGQPLPSLAPMLANVLPSVVSVHVSGTETPKSLNPAKPTPPNNRGPGRSFEGLGSGVIIDATKGYVLTNYHVINGADKISVQLNDGRKSDAKLIGKDAQSDIALIQMVEVNNLTAIKIADSDQLRVGDFTVAIGNPFGLGQTATSGIISALGRSGLNLEGFENFIQTDASINRGNSGGALVNLNGELIGINTAILAPSGGNIGIGFAIPSNMAQSLSKQLIEFGEVKRSILGIKGSEMNAEMAKAFKLDTQRGAFVNEVLKDSGAAKAGIMAGDVLVSLDGKTINSFAELRAKISTAGSGKAVKIGLLRDGKPLEVSVTLQTNDIGTEAERLLPLLQGANLSNGTTASGEKGVKLLSVTENSSAAALGLQKDDVIVGINRERIADLEQLRKALTPKPEVVALSVMRGNDNLYLLLR